ncbi:helix-turn-helix domain-containing protein [Sporomusa aerivorans]|uniref:helix-turn-helix domain-containing protein n=1 Tax=Sporomusa aerivorans TaxID=204936 RepID=UPI00352B5810
MEVFIMGKKLKVIRQQKGLMQRYVSQKLGIHNSYLCKIENGTVRPTAEIINKLYELYEIA